MKGLLIILHFFASSSSFQACQEETCNTGYFADYADEPSFLIVCSSSAQVGFLAFAPVLTCTIFAKKIDYDEVLIENKPLIFDPKKVLL